ncbi:hypothetical protein BP6252_11974 [Coleophoma cylindrospora]|uniref:MARVEL domain-containing protein n=1 Tax=Coleophoma cylindrospora TaxID=1849047 RepID=A0A3D8QFU7_9HELO|nr:hypothetical protein BP6252_11974 [Coleophoma cylindrospora]
MYPPPKYRQRVLTYAHVVQLILVLIAVIITVVRMFAFKPTPTPTTTRSRGNTIALSMGAKSLMFILYQMLTKHVAAFRRWKSAKANAILNIIDIVSWAAVAYLGIQSNMKRCVGTSCLLSWIVVILAIILSIISIPTAYISWVDYRYFRIHHCLPGEAPSKEVSNLSNQGDRELARSRRSRHKTSPKDYTYTHAEVGQRPNGSGDAAPLPHAYIRNDNPRHHGRRERRQDRHGDPRDHNDRRTCNRYEETPYGRGEIRAFNRDEERSYRGEERSHWVDIEGGRRYQQRGEGRSY